jgi:hypothetical protein
MVVDSPDGAGTETHLVVAHMGMAMEFSGSVVSDTSIQIEHLAIVQLDVRTQIEWLDDFSEILLKLRPYLQNQVLLDKVEAIVAEMRADRAGPEPQQDTFRALCTRAAPLLRTLSRYVANFTIALVEQEARDKLLELMSSFLR